MQHPHDTDRILAVLGEAIEALRVADAPYYKGGERYSVADEVANDLALLHGAVSAEAQRADEEAERRDPMRAERELRARLRAQLRTQNIFPKPKDIDVKRSEAGRLRYLHREELEAEVARHEHDDEERGIR